METTNLAPTVCLVKSWLPGLQGKGYFAGGLVLAKHGNAKQRLMSNLGYIAYKAWLAPQRLIFSADCTGRPGEAECGLDCIYFFAC